MGTPDPLVGKTFAGRFEILRQLGAGGMGAVYLARQISMDREVVLKVIHPQIAGSAQAAQRFHREMQTTSKIEHPNTIQVYDFGESEDGQLFLAIEFVEGRTLTKLLEESGALPLERIVRIASQVARALGAAHAEGIVHRDLKPDNVMLLDKYEQKDFVKVLDFGIAKFLDENKTQVTADGGVIGTPNYMSPEQASGRGVDHRSDLYSLGVMLYQMATGVLPFQGPTPISLILQHTTEAPRPPSELLPGKVDPRLEQLILDLLAKGTDARPPTAMAVVERLESLVLAPGSLVPGTRLHEAPHSAGVTKWIVLGAVVILGVAGGIAVPKLTKRPPPGPSPARLKLDQVLTTDGEPPTPEKCRRGDDKSVATLAEVGALIRTSPGEAAAKLKELGDVGDQQAEYWLLVARAQLAVDQPAEAAAATEKALALCAESALGQHLAGNAAQRLRRLDEAERAYQQASALAPAWGAPRYNLGLVALRKNDPQKAIATFDQLLQATPDHPSGYLTRGQAHLVAQHANEAQADLEEATRRQPRSADAWLWLGKARQAANQGPAAQSAFCKAKELGSAEAVKLCDGG